MCACAFAPDWPSYTTPFSLLPRTSLSSKCPSPSAPSLCVSLPLRLCLELVGPGLHLYPFQWKHVARLPLGRRGHVGLHLECTRRIQPPLISHCTPLDAGNLLKHTAVTVASCFAASGYSSIIHARVDYMVPGHMDTDLLLVLVLHILSPVCSALFFLHDHQAPYDEMELM